MIEVIYDEGNEESGENNNIIKLPKNIRQMGSPNGNRKNDLSES